MSWQDFDLDSQLERDLLSRALPVVPTSSSGAHRTTLDQATGVANHAATLVSHIGASPTSCIELLSIRPLLLGAAWKTVDLLLETAFELGGVLGAVTNHIPISAKESHARQHSGRPAAIDAPLWAALCEVYANTVDLRHSLVHRRAYVNGSDELVGVDKHGSPISHLTALEQEAFSRAAQLAAELVTSTPPDSRTHADLARELSLLTRLHSETFTPVALAEVPPEWTIIVDPSDDGTGGYQLDLGALRSRVGGVLNVDLIVQFRDRPGQERAGRLEMAPVDNVVTINPDQPPTWLR